MKTEYYRLRAEELHNRLLQMRQFNIKHKLTIGMFAEDLLRDFLRISLPQKIGIAQGFIVDDSNNCSNQCDIIIYDKQNYAPLFVADSTIILPSKAVIAVIEVKISIRKMQFDKTLRDFEQLHKIGVARKYLFIYNSCSVRTLETYFYINNETDDFFNIGKGKYDYDNFEALPDAIIGLKSNSEFLLKKDYVTTDSRDMIGYTSLILNDKMNRTVSCLQGFLEILNSHVNNASEGAPELDFSINKYEGIALFDL